MIHQLTKSRSYRKLVFRQPDLVFENRPRIREVALSYRKLVFGQRDLVFENV